MNFSRLIIMIFAVFSLLILGCSSPPTADHQDQAEAGQDDHGHGEGGVAVTLYQNGLELFAEWPPFVVGQTSKAVLHFTSMESFEPVTEGSLHVKWVLRKDTVKTQTAASVTRTGIFVVELETPGAGIYDLVFDLQSPGMSGAIVVSSTQVFKDTASVVIPDEDHDTEEFSFLKEQQWMLGTRTGLVEIRTLHDNFRAPGELKPAGSRMSEVFTPFAGVLMPDHDNGAVRHGQRVRKGQSLAMLSPSPNANNSWYGLSGEYRLAKSEFERLEKLAAENAISNKRLQIARQNLSIKSAQLTAALGGAEICDIDEGNPHFTIRSPRDGVIVQHAAAYGSFVEPGTRLFSIVDPSLIWLEVQVAAVDAESIQDIQHAYFRLGGSSRLYYTGDFDAKVIASGSILDPETRRVPITFELQNREGELKVGGFAQVNVQTSVARETMAVLRPAVIDDDGSPVVYVQTGGESFVRRAVTLGTVDGEWVEVLSGLEAGERVATVGAYKVKLASSATDEVGHGHAH
jgi:RND family efflux transporter MFP subunit